MSKKYQLSDDRQKRNNTMAVLIKTKEAQVGSVIQREDDERITKTFSDK